MVKFLLTGQKYWREHPCAMTFITEMNDLKQTRSAVYKRL